MCTFNFLERHLDFSSINTVCVIGDGQANFVSPLLATDTFPKLISVNLPEVLLSDLELLSKSLISETSIVVSTTPQDLSRALHDPTVKLILVPASCSTILSQQPIDLFVNIVSFGEMNNNIIADYFSIIKSSVTGAYLYCCNRLTKRLDACETTAFYNYPWDPFESIYCDEPCPWHQKFYTTRFLKLLPFPMVLRPYHGQINHRLVKYSPSR